MLCAGDACVFFESRVADGWLTPEREQVPLLTQFLFIY